MYGDGAAKERLVLDDVVHHPEWLSASECFHQIVRPGEDSVEAILADVFHVLLEVRCESHLLQHVLESGYF